MFWIRHRKICAFLITLPSKKHNFVRVNYWLVPLSGPFQNPTVLFFLMQHFNDGPPTSYITNIIAGVRLEFLIGVRFSSCHPTTVANNQRYHSLSIIFSSHQQKISLSMKDCMDLILVFSPMDPNNRQWVRDINNFLCWCSFYRGFLNRKIWYQKTRHQKSITLFCGNNINTNQNYLFLER